MQSSVVAQDQSKTWSSAQPLYQPQLHQSKRSRMLAAMRGSLSTRPDQSRLPVTSGKPAWKFKGVSIGDAWRMSTYEKGISAESCARKKLEADGYRIIDRRIRTKYGEIDILAKRGDDLIAVEVKQRKSLDSARSCITQKQQRRISNAMLAVISEREEPFENYRVDVICFDTVGRFEHIENAFPIQEFCC